MPPINETDIKLMLAMIASAESLKTDNQKLADLLADGSTPNAVRQRVQKIKNLAKAVLAGEAVKISGGAAKKGAAKTTPSKRKADSAAPEDTPETPATKKRASPAKKTNATPKAKGAIKKEAEDGQDVVSIEGDAALQLDGADGDEV